MINLTANSLSISVWMIFCLFGWKRQTFFQTSREIGKTLSLWEATDGLIPDIFELVQVKHSS